MQTASSSTSSSSRWKYDVFLSFRDEDKRKSFIDHLHTAFNQKGLRVFRDDEELERKPMSPELLHAIEESRSAVVVFSRNYASSTRRLDELVKIAHCMNTKIVPVFDNVDPLAVRNQTGEFQEAFVKHEETFREDIEKVQTWRNALTEVTSRSGFTLKDGYESQFIQEIVKEISSKLSFPKYASHLNLVGIDSRLDKLKKLISPESLDVRMIGICGMGGIGKTTIARVAYEMFSNEFEGSSFLANVTEVFEKDGLLSLQKMLLSQILHMRKADINLYNVFDGISMIRRRLSCKKVLIVIDDVNSLEQLEKLAGKHDWFGIGSRIIITSRNTSLLTSHGIDGVYEVEELNYDEALQLFISTAFKKHQPSKNFRELTKCFTQFARGIPLALKVLGSSLYGKEVHEWELLLRNLNSNGHRDIFYVLRISFDGLRESEKKIFLDIACFFKGENRYYVTRILEGCGFFPKIGIDILIERSLITILDDHRLSMHDLLQQMGQQIVKTECPSEPGKRSRLWIEADIHHVLIKNTGTDAVEGIMLNFSEKKIHCCARVFSKMVNLRLLKIHNVQLSQGLDYLSNELRLLDWEGYPLKSLPPNLQLERIVELKMDQSCIKQLQQGIIPFNPFNNLESISFRECDYLIKTIDFKFAPNLKDVDLSKCKMLCEVHPSLFVHKKITFFIMEACVSLATLPNQIHMESLEVLHLSSCCKLEKFPEIVGRMDCLRSLSLSQSAIKVLPMSIELLSALETLDLDDCKNLVSLPNTMNGLKSLRELTLCGCFKLDNLPKTLGQVEKLEILRVRETAIRRPMSSIFLIKNLKKLDFRGCKGPPSNLLSSLLRKTFRLPTLSDYCRSLQELILSDCNMEEEAIPNDFFRSFSSLWWLDLSKNNFVSLHGSIKHLSELEHLDLNGCKKLRSLPELPSNIKYINVNGCVALETTSNALRLCNSKLSDFLCVNCLKLICCNNLASSIPREFLKAMSKPINEFSMVIPGSEIPKWFQHQSETSSIKIERPSDSYDNMMVGYAICCVFEDDYMMDVYYMATHVISCTVTTKKTTRTTWIQLEENLGKVVSNHLWLFYFAERLYQDFVELSFKSDVPGLAVKRCGIHPVYEKELKELQPRTNKSSSSSFWKSYALDEDFLGSTVDVDNDGSDDKPISEIITSPIFINGESSSRCGVSRVNEKEIEGYSDNEDKPSSKRFKGLTSFISFRIF